MIHTWLPRSARLVEADIPNAPESRMRWFHEGFTEYLARLTLVEIGLKPSSWMVDLTNEDLERLAYQPYRTATLDDLEAASREGRYSNIHHRLHYVRGALLALNWDTRIRRGSDGDESIVDAIRLIVEHARERSGTIERQEFTRILEQFGVDAEQDIERHLEGGIPLQADPGSCAPDYELVIVELPGFDPGFDVVHWLAEGEVSGMKSGGPADRAGLREGMKIRRSGNAAPWVGRWDPSQPSVFLIDGGGDHGGDTEQRFEVSAARGKIRVPVYTSDSTPESRDPGS